MRAASWQTEHFPVTSCFPFPSGSLTGAVAAASPPPWPGGRPGQALGKRGALLSVRATSTVVGRLANTSFCVESALWYSPPTPWTTYFPVGTFAEYRPCAWLITMNVKRRSAFFIFTKAPATGAPAASLTTPCSTPRLSAPRTELTDTIAINTKIATIFPFIRFGITFLLRGFLVKDIFNLSMLVGNKERGLKPATTFRLKHFGQYVVAGFSPFACYTPAEMIRMPIALLALVSG